MKRVLAVFVAALMLVVGYTLPLSAEETTTETATETTAPASSEDIPVTVDEDFPAAVENIVTKNALITNAERIPVKDVQMVIDSCADALATAENVLVPVDTQTVLKVDVLKLRGTVECTAEYVYTTSVRQGVKYEWMYFADGRVEKTVSYDYEERASDFAVFTYKVRNINNETLEKTRVEVAEEEFQIDITDMLFGMAIAVVLMMIAVIIIRAIKKA